MDIGLTLPNRGVLLGASTSDQMLDLAEAADQSGVLRSVWMGDSLLGKPRMESVSLLAGIPARTRRVRLGPACMASFVLRDPVLLSGAKNGQVKRTRAASHFSDPRRMFGPVAVARGEASAIGTVATGKPS